MIRRGTNQIAKLSRRQILGAAPALALGLTGCAMAADEGPVMTWHMPLESAPHLRTFMQWPVSLDVYDPRSLRSVQRAIATVANTIAEFEPVVMLAGAEHHAAARRLLSADIEIWDIPTDDLWCRDSGPTFVIDRTGQTAIMHLRFNGWGNKQPHAADAQVTPLLAERLSLPLIDSGLVGEQGGVEHDGAGTLLAHASCWANPNRNTAGADVIAQRLLAALGGQQMIWAPGIIGADITDYHIDALARFVAPGHVLIQLPAAVDPADPWSRAAQETHDILRSATDAQGRPLTITRLPEPVNIRGQGDDFVASYVNYYVCNGAVIGAQFGDRRADAQARETLASLYPDREIMLLNVDALGENGGGIHCATQQQPRFSA
jgi:agmatine deiminase